MIHRHLFNSYARVALVGVLAFSLLGAAAMSNARPAAADPAINIWSIPSISYVGDGMDQVIGVKALLEVGSFVDVIRVLVDPGTANERVYEFEANGDFVSADAVFSFGLILNSSDTDITPTE